MCSTVCRLSYTSCKSNSYSAIGKPYMSNAVPTNLCCNRNGDSRIWNTPRTGWRLAGYASKSEVLPSILCVLITIDPAIHLVNLCTHSIVICASKYMSFEIELLVMVGIDSKIRSIKSTPASSDRSQLSRFEFGTSSAQSRSQALIYAAPFLYQELAHLRFV